LMNVRSYTYSGEDKSILANYVMQPFWRYSVNYLPTWMAPNLVTLIGFLFIFISYFTTVYYIPEFKGEAPSWVYLLNAACMFIYQTMDALDGKQARRTNTSSPLGELFDHGCDAVVTVVGALTLASTLQTQLWVFLPSIVIMMLAFYFTHCEEFYIGKLILWYLGVTEAQIASITIYLMTFILGPSFWTTTFTYQGVHLSYGDIPILVGGVTCAITIVSNVYTIARVKLNTRAFIGTLPAIVFSLVFVAWAYTSSVDIYVAHPHIFVINYGMVLAYLVGRVVLARVCCEPFPDVFGQSLLLPLFLIPVFILNPSSLHHIEMGEEKFLYLYCSISIFAYLEFALSVVKDLCKTLKIRCFHIPYKKLA